jgi:hypothetical protein
MHKREDVRLRTNTSNPFDGIKRDKKGEIKQK